MRSMTLHQPSSFPKKLRKALEDICASEGVTRACKEHTKFPGRKLLDKFFKAQLSSIGYSVESDRLRVTENARFDLDLLITEPDWRTAVLIEGGQAARVDLALLKFIVWGRNIDSPHSGYAALLVSDKKLLRTITGTTDEAAFDYLKRLRPLFSATAPNVADLLIVEFKSQ